MICSASSTRPGTHAKRWAPRPRARCARPSKRRLAISTPAACASPRKIAGEWHVHQWLKKAVLLSFRLNDMKMIDRRPAAQCGGTRSIPNSLGWDEAQFRAAGFRAVPGADRAPLGLHRQGRRADAQLRQCRRACGRGHDDRHLGDGRLLRADRRAIAISRAASGIGGVLEPVQAAPTIIEDNCFIGARAEVAEGVIVGEGRCCRWACS